MSQSIAMRKKWSEVVEQMGAITALAASEGRNMSTEENLKWGRMYADEKRFRDSIAAIESTEGLQRSLEQIRENDSRRSHDRGRETAGLTYDQAWLRYIRDKPTASSAQVHAVLDKGDPSIPKERRDMSVGTGTLGGYTVPAGFRAQLVEALKWYGGVRATRAYEFSTDTGNSMPMPTDNDTTNTGAILGEGSADSTQDDALGQITFNAYKYTSKIIKVSIELLQDSAFDVTTFLAKKLGIRIARIQNTHFTTGDNSSKPYGFVNNAVANSATVTAAGSTAITYNDIVNLKFGVDAAYRVNGEWSMNDQIWAAVLKLVNSNGRPLVLPTDQGLGANAPLTFWGQPVHFNNDMSSALTTGQSVMAYGDFSAYFIRNVLNPSVIRFNERYMDAYQVGFSVIYRGDGRLVDAGTKPVYVLKLA